MSGWATTDDPFMTMMDAKSVATDKVFGERGKNGRYHMPLLPGEDGVKSGGDWVPSGIQSVTNLAGAFEDTRALGIWEQCMAMIGLALSPDIYEELVLLVHQERAKGTKFELLREYAELKEALAGKPNESGNSIVGRAKQAARANAAAQAGTNRHTAWEHRGATGQLIGTPAIQGQIIDTERLLREAGLERVPGLSERVVRNLGVNVAGRFDDILSEMRTGRLIIGDLKTKATEFYTWLTVDAQEAMYAHAEWMLSKDGRTYEPGPRMLGVDLAEGVVLHVPSDGSPAYLRRADLTRGWRVAKLARAVTEERSYGKSAGRASESAWIPRTS